MILVDTCHSERFRGECTHEKQLYKSSVFNFFLTMTKPQKRMNAGPTSCRDCCDVCSVVTLDANIALTHCSLVTRTLAFRVSCVNEPGSRDSVYTCIMSKAVHKPTNLLTLQNVSGKMRICAN